jgi:hypothetical protein
VNENVFERAGTQAGGSRDDYPDLDYNPRMRELKFAGVERGRMTSIGRCSLVLAVAINALLSACQCEVRSAEPEAPPRPSGVHAKAIWAGGIDGGAFILLIPAKPDGTYAARIYNDHSGDLEFNGKLRLKELSQAPIDVNDPKTYSGWDGESLFLRDGRILRPVK